MAITKEKKKEIIAGLEKIIKDSKSAVFVNFHKLLVKDADNIRKSLKKENVDYLVTKKTLIKKVLKESNIKGQVPTLEGELALAFLSPEVLTNGESDLLAPARSIYGFQKELGGKVSIIGGVFDGEYKSQEEMISIASIPSLLVLRGMFVNVINSPIQRFAIALGQIASKK